MWVWEKNDVGELRLAVRLWRYMGPIIKVRCLFNGLRPVCGKVHARGLPLAFVTRWHPC